MSGLERELRMLAASLDWPEEPDVAPDVAGRLAQGPQTVGRTRRRITILAIAAAVAAFLAVLAVPPARTAILDWLGIGGARITRVDELPAVSPTRSLDVLGDPTTLADARTHAGFGFADPPRDEPAPTEIRLEPGLRVSYVWREGARVRLLITQFPGRVGDPALSKKLAGEATRIEQLDLAGDPAVWLEGAPHVVLFVAPDGSVREDESRLAGNTLLVDRGGTPVRIEGDLRRDDAVALASAMHP